MANNYGPSIVKSGLVLALDAANRKSYAGSGTVWRDLTNNVPTSSLVNGPGFDSGNGGSITFDKTDDHVLVGGDINTSIIQLWTRTGNFSCQVWCNPTDSGEGSSCRIVENTDPESYGDGSGSGWALGIDNISGTNAAHLYIVDNFPRTNLYFNNFFTTYSTWYNITATVAGTVCKIYKNGVLFGTQNSSFPMDMSGTNLICLIGNVYFLNKTFNGKIANVLVYPNRTLSADEVLQNYNATKGRFKL